jgi:ATP-dependent protease HslVU (ClpYQ) peptidase subunit
MTTIALCRKARIMACDSAWSDDNYLFDRQVKIYRNAFDVIYGSAGDCTDRDFLKWMETIQKPADFPMVKDFEPYVQDGGDFTVLMSFPTGECYWFNKCKDDNESSATMEFFEIQRPFIAIGSGRLAAMASMFTQQRLCKSIDPVIAIEAACDVDRSSCKPVHFLKHQAPLPK